ncbi:DUF418 family protein [Erwinia psidii]|uniref:DUF418 domain-containing protein YeiB n=1 Tax=Erwinia psidii TaxID=69224 RepID=UPI00226B35A2|nr:DUF418 domain-containing protein YeiB [Erwinia psidii]MCX8966756.1 DUF418 family protein [Erwinia psidii]
MPRIPTLDFIRGLAILGILLLNIVAFGLPRAAYLNPAWHGLPHWQDALSWAAVDLFAQIKFLSLFALLFGAGLQMLLPNGKRWLQARLSWLVLFGFLHGVFFWDGDILLDYGLIGLVVWRMIRDVGSPRQLFSTGVLLYMVGSVLLIVLGMAAGGQANDSWLPGFAEVQYEMFWKTHGGWEAMRNRLDMLSSGLLSLGVQYGWQLAGLMMMGAALMQCGWLRGSWSQVHYRRCALMLIGSAWLIQIPAIYLQWISGWDFRWAAFYLQVPRELGAPLQGAGYAALCFGYWPVLSRLKMTFAISCVGRMALSNYLLQTALSTTLFNRLGWFNQLDRWQLLLLVPLVWLCNILFSLCWLRYFRRGPVEWLWHKLTLLTGGPPPEKNA